ncbi:MAG: bifunctional UDP-N-acetylglucosamine diphosphorylase/glucosamine-1-phosphate N-acetyltransferase GlmU [Propionibacteriaceae bacterium]
MSSTPESAAPTEPGRGVAAVIVLAAGEGTRMRSTRAKVLHKIAGHSLLSHAIDAAAAVESTRIAVVVGHQREQVVAHLSEIAPHVQPVTQGDAAYGTGYAVRCALEELGELSGDVLVTLGDVPLLTGDTVVALLNAHREAGAAVTVLSAEVVDPTGYGRIVRDATGAIQGIVEHRDADPVQRAGREINSGVIAFDADLLSEALTRLAPNGPSGELYLTDVVEYARSQGLVVHAHVTPDHWQIEGVNDRVQLQAVAGELNRRICAGWMRAGVSIEDPSTTWIHRTVDLGTDVTLRPGTFLEGATSIAAGATIGPEVTLVDTEVGEGASVVRTQAVLAVIGAGASVGPYASLRPGTTVGAQGKIGTFVETKNARIGPGAKVPHLTYAGDAVIDEGANIGAGVIFANYDGVTKSSTHVGRYSFVGSDSTLVAPCEVADGAYVAAGSTITMPVGAGELAVARGSQRNVRGWVARKRAGTKTAAAAEQAQQEQARQEQARQEQARPEQAQHERARHDQQHHDRQIESEQS